MVTCRSYMSIACRCVNSVMAVVYRSPFCLPIPVAVPPWVAIILKKGPALPAQPLRNGF